MEKPRAIWLFAGGSMQKPVVDKIKERGYNVILTDGFDKPYCLPFVDEFVHLDRYDLEGNAAAARTLSEKYDIRAAMTAGSDSCEGPAVVAKTLGIHGIDPEIARLYRYKHLHRDILTKAGIPQPRFLTAATFEQAQHIIEEMGFPLCFKSTNNAGSIGFSAIHTPNDATEAAFNAARNAGTSGLVLIEELLEPIDTEIAEQSVETVWYNGEMHWLNWVDRPFRKDMRLFPEVDASRYENIAWSVEIGHLNPAVHDITIFETVRDMVYRAGVALGIATQKGGHIMKCDIMLTKKGPYILEPTLRLSGGWDSAGSTVARGADFIGGAIEMALGGELTDEVFDTYFRYRLPDLQAAVLTNIPPGGQTGMGRDFALGTGSTRIEALQNAEIALEKREYLGAIQA